MKALIFICSLFASLSACSQALQKIETFQLVDSFPKGGFTTAGSGAFFSEIESLKIRLIPASEDDVQKFCATIKNCATRTHWQQKLPPRLSFAYVRSSTGLHRIVIVSNDCFIDLTDKREYRFQSKPDTDWFADFIARMKATQ